MSESGLAEFLARAALEMAAADDETELTRIACEQSLKVVPTADFCGITNRIRRGRLESIAVTDDRARRSDQAQYELEEGPCVSAASDGDVAPVVADTLTDRRWPRWGERAADLGIRSVSSVQLPAVGMHDRHEALGAINVYSSRVAAFGSRESEVTMWLAAHLAVAWANLRRTLTLTQAMESRALVGTAQGILISRLGLSPDAAFQVLRRVSSASNVKLREVAEVIIGTGELPSSEQVATWRRRG